jgi:gluconokinase
MAPSVIVVMGVSGSGKTTVASLLAQRLRWRFAEADEFHPAANIAKMSAGIALTDEDRAPWLDAIAALIDSIRGANQHGVVTCSALKRAYRERLVHGHDDVRFVYLQGERDLVAKRMRAREGHYMPLALLQSQFDTLEEPGAGENTIAVSIDATPDEIVATIVAALGLEVSPSPGER